MSTAEWLWLVAAIVATVGALVALLGGRTQTEIRIRHAATPAALAVLALGFVFLP